MIDFERQLRDDVRRAMATPSPRLRERTLASLHEHPRAMAIARTRPWTLPALAACLLLTLSAGIAAVLLTPQTRPASSTIAPRIAVQTRLSLTLPRTSTPMLGEPLLNEARLLARDAQRTFARFKDGLPSPPKFNRVETGAGSPS